nr:hypothetical protein [Acidobacteriota bacterium]
MRLDLFTNGACLTGNRRVLGSSRERQLWLYELLAWVLVVNYGHIRIYPEPDKSYDLWVRSPEELEKIVKDLNGILLRGFGGKSRRLAVVQRVRRIGMTGRE